MKAKIFLASENHNIDSISELDKIIGNLSIQLGDIGTSILTYKGGKPEKLTQIVPLPQIVPIQPQTLPPLPNMSEPIEEKLQQLMVEDKNIHIALEQSEQKEKEKEILAQAAIINMNRGEDQALRALANQVTEVVIVNEEAPRNLSVTEAINDPLKVNFSLQKKDQF